MTYDQAVAIVAEGLRRRTRRHRSIALGVATQFELTLRQVDVDTPTRAWSRSTMGIWPRATLSMRSARQVRGLALKQMAFINNLDVFVLSFYPRQGLREVCRM
jgi:hypothetical protein